MFSCNSYRRDHRKLTSKQRPNVVALVIIAVEAMVMVGAASAAEKEQETHQQMRERT